MSARPKPAPWGEAVRQVQDEAGGVLAVTIVRKEDAARLVLNTLTGDDAAAALLRKDVARLRATAVNQ